MKITQEMTTIQEVHGASYTNPERTKNCYATGQLEVSLHECTGLQLQLSPQNDLRDGCRMCCPWFDHLQSMNNIVGFCAYEECYNLPYSPIGL